MIVKLAQRESRSTISTRAMLSDAGRNYQILSEKAIRTKNFSAYHVFQHEDAKMPQAHGTCFKRGDRSLAHYAAVENARQSHSEAASRHASLKFIKYKHDLERNLNINVNAESIRKLICGINNKVTG